MRGTRYCICHLFSLDCLSHHLSFTLTSILDNWLHIALDVLGITAIVSRGACAGRLTLSVHG